MKSGKSSQRRALDRDDQIADMKRMLEEMESSRRKKDLELMKKNELLVARDNARHEEFLEKYKTPEQLAAAAAAVEVKRIEGLKESLQDREDEARSVLEEEEAIESKIVWQESRLEFICITVAAVHAEHCKIEHQRVLKEEAIERLRNSYEKLKVTLSTEESDKRRVVERVYNQEWRVLEAMKLSDRQKVASECERRHTEEVQAQKIEEAKKVEEMMCKGALELNAEEDSLERELEEMTARITRSYRQAMEPHDHPPDE